MAESEYDGSQLGPWMATQLTCQAVEGGCENRQCVMWPRMLVEVPWYFFFGRVHSQCVKLQAGES